jgi:flagellar assembly protein FliH
LSRLLHRPAMDAAPRTMGTPEPALDPFTRRRVDEAAAEAYERGRADGRREAVEQARAAAEQAANRVGAAVREAVDVAVAELGELRRSEALADTELACRIAEVVIGREPHDGGQALLDRCREALAALDDVPLKLRVNPDDSELLATQLVTNGDLQLVEDASLAPGEARIQGRWGRADLTREAAWALVREVLEPADD